MIALIFCGDLKYCPYIQRYIERIEEKDEKYVVLFWNRTGGELSLPDQYRYFDKSSALKANSLVKLRDFFQFGKWVKSQLKKNEVDKCIILTTLTGILVYYALRIRKVPYIFDIRDYSYEHFPLFFHIEKKLIKNSVLTAISSKGFKKFLPEDVYITAHNMNRKEVSKSHEIQRGELPIKVVWLGVMRFFDFQKKVIDALANDERYQLIYHGDGPELDRYRRYCMQKNIENVIFTGEYANTDKEKLLEDADIINNAYGYPEGEDDLPLRYAVSNKFYDGIIYHIPQIVEIGGYKEEIVKRTGVGLAREIKNNFADELFEYYNSIQKKQFDLACENALQRILEDDDRYIEAIDSFVLRGNA